MNCLTHSDLKNWTHYKLQNRTFLRLIIIILVTLWSWPAAAGPNSGTDNDNARKNLTNNANRSMPQNIQPVQPMRSSHRDATSQSGSLPTRTFSSPQPSFTPPSAKSSSRGTIQFRSDSQTPSFNQPKATERTTASDMRRQLGGSQSISKSDSMNRTPPAIESTTIRKFNVPKLELTADTPKSNNGPSDNSDQRSGRQVIRQRVQGNIQAVNPAGTGQTNQNTGAGGAAGSTATTPTPGARLFHCLQAAATLPDRRMSSGDCRIAGKSLRRPLRIKLIKTFYPEQPLINR